MENRDLLEMASFNSYVKLPEGYLSICDIPTDESDKSPEG